MVETAIVRIAGFPTYPCKDFYRMEELHSIAFLATYAVAGLTLRTTRGWNNFFLQTFQEGALFCRIAIRDIDLVSMKENPRGIAELGYPGYYRPQEVFSLRGDTKETAEEKADRDRLLEEVTKTQTILVKLQNPNNPFASDELQQCIDTLEKIGRYYEQATIPEVTIAFPIARLSPLD